MLVSFPPKKLYTKFCLYTKSLLIKGCGQVILKKKCLFFCSLSNFVVDNLMRTSVSQGKP